MKKKLIGALASVALVLFTSCQTVHFLTRTEYKDALVNGEYGSPKDSVLLFGYNVHWQTFIQQNPEIGYKFCDACREPAIAGREPVFKKRSHVVKPEDYLDSDIIRFRVQNDFQLVPEFVEPHSKKEFSLEDGYFFTEIRPDGTGHLLLKDFDVCLFAKTNQYFRLKRTPFFIVINLKTQYNQLETY